VFVRADALVDAADRIDALEAEVARLRGVLEELIYLSDNDGPFAGEIWQDRCDRGWNDARAALKEQEKDDDI